MVGLEQWNTILRYGVCCAPIVPNLKYVSHIQIACVKAISTPVAVILDDVRMFYAIKLFKEDDLILAFFLGFQSWLLRQFRSYSSEDSDHELGKEDLNGWWFA